MKTKRKTGKLLSLVLAFVLALGALPVMPGGVTAKAAETISTVSATTIPLLAGTSMKDVFTGVTFDTSKMTMDQVVIYDVKAAKQWDSKTCAETYEKFVEGKDYTITLVLNPREGYSFAVTAATINGITAVIEYQSAGSVTFTCKYTVPEATALQNVDILVTDPKSGETPNYTASVAEAQKDMVSVSGDIYWGYGEDGSYPVASNGDGTFVKEREYTVIVTLEPGVGYKLTEETVCTINGNPATFDAEYNRAIYQYPPLETVLLETASATCNLIHGTKLSEYDFGIPEDAGYEVNTVSWYEGIGSSASSISSTATIDETKEYTLTFTLQAKEGYRFTDATTFTVNVPEEATVDLTLDRTLKTKKIKVLFTKKVVGKTNITLPLPVVGEPLPTAVSDNENCIVTSVGWELDSIEITDPNYIVEDGKTYVASIILKPSARYSLWDTDNLSKTEIGARITLNHASVNEEHMIFLTPSTGRTMIYTIYMDSHTHDYAAEWSKNETDHWHECSGCGDKKDVAEHTYDAGKVTKEATETAEGIKTFTCSACNMAKTETIPVKGHSYGSEWSKDENSHWHECTNPGCPDKTGSVKDKAAHTYDGGKVTTPATGTTQGVKTYTCTVCGNTKTESIPATGDSAGSGTGDKGNTSGTGGKNPAVGASVKDEKGTADYKITTAAGADGTSARQPAVEYVAPTDKNVKSVSIPATITAGGVTYKVTAIADNAFKNNKNLTSVKIGSNVVSIGKNAFYGCKKLQKVTIGNGVTTIGASAFSGCSKLKTVTIGKDVTTIGDKAFYKCTSLTKITIPANVSKIGKQAFYGCTKLKTVIIKTTKLTSKKVAKNAFGKNAKKVTVTLPKMTGKKKADYKKMLKTKGLKAAKFK